MLKTLKIFFIISFFMVQFASASERMLKQSSSSQEDISIINIDKIESMILGSISEQLKSDKVMIDLRNYKKGIKLNTRRDFFDAAIVESSLNEKNRRFSYKIEFSNNEFRQIVDINGAYDEAVSVPALSVKIPKGEIIREEDIEYIDVASRKIRPDTILDQDDLVGKIIKSSKAPLIPVRKRDVQQKQIVGRADNINIIYKTPAITLSATGVAMDDGGEGDLIRVKNLSSNKIVQAVVQSSSTALVSTGNL
jgi:flagella basal body P-ring formation protein FlgA